MIFNRKPVLLLILILASVCVLSSCTSSKFLGIFNRTSVKNPPKDSTPFVFGNEIIVEKGVVPKDEQKRLESELDSYWDDTIKARTVQQFGLFYRIKNPQRFDTFGLHRSRVFMNSYLQSQGYYNAVLKDSIRIDSFRYGRKSQQFRVTPIMIVNPGQRLTFDSIGYDFVDTANAPNDSSLHQLALKQRKDSYLEHGEPYSKQIIAAELDRLVAHFRNNGYYRLNRDNLAALVDTTDQLIDSLIIDPFELARVTAEAAERRRQNPTADVTIMQATQAKTIPFDSSVITQYRIARIFYYPETDATTDIPDSLLLKNDFKIRGGTTTNIYMKYRNEESLFRMRPLIRNTYLPRGDLYSDRAFYRTVNTLGQIGAWQQVEWRDSIRGDSVDFHIFLSPARKKNIKTELELTRSTADFASSNNLFGIGGNITFLNRNFRKRAIQWSTFVRGGVELNLESDEKFLQTFQFGAGTSLVYPHLWRPFNRREKTFDAGRTILNINGNYTDRADFFRVRSFVSNLNWEFRKGTIGWGLGGNIELYSLDILPKLADQLIQNPFLQTAFNTGSVYSVFGRWSATIGSVSNPYLSQFVRVGGELAGIPAYVAMVFDKNTSLKDDLYQYLRVEGEYTRKIQKPKTERVWRAFVGLGLPIRGQTLPFFKQFVAGGPNSMRGWGLRQLGLGSSLLSDTSDEFSDRFGDVQLEANYEYRFLVTNIGGVKYNSALFIDVGNIWNLKKDPANPRGQIRFDKIPDDLAVALGLGLMRLNVANFIIRVDFALKLKDPARREAEWLFEKFTWRNRNGNSNYAFQIGIGLPF